MWEGVLHINPAPSGKHGDVESQLHALLRPLAQDAGLRMRGQFNVGEEGDYRVPDAGLDRDPTDRVYYATAALVIEIVSPGDGSRGKLEFYDVVEELVIVDPQEKTVTGWGSKAASTST